MARIVPYQLSKKETQTATNPSDKIERLIDEAKRAKKTDSPKTHEAESERKTSTNEKAVQDEVPTPKRGLKEEVLVTLTETSKELSRIIGVLLEREAPSTEPQILPRFCCHCGRDLLPNGLYCDQCGASIRGA